MYLWSLLRRVRSFLENCLHPARADSELDRELESYVELLTDERTHDGTRRNEVRRKLLAQMGGKESVKERVRERRIGASVETFVRDVHLAWRLLWRNPGFSFLMIATLALGIGAGAAVFSVVSGVLLRELPFPSADRLALVAANARDGRTHLSAPDFVDFAETSASFEALAAIQGGFFATLSVGDEPIAVRAREVTSEFLSVYGLSPHLGRAFGASDRDIVDFERLGDPNASLPTGVLMLGYEFWRERFGGDPAVLGSLVELEYRPYRIVGITPPGFRTLLPDDADFSSLVDVWTLSRMPFASMPRDTSFLRVVGRLKPRVLIDEARAEAALFAGRQRERFPVHAESGYELDVIVLEDVLTAGHAKTLWVLFGAVCVLMLIACANLAGLLLTRALARRKELAVRMALGSGRARLVRQLGTESLLHALFAVALGVPLGSALVELFKDLAPASIPRIAEVHFDASVLVLALAASLVAAIAVAVIPAAQFSRNRELQMLQGAGRRLAGGERNRFRPLLVVAEIALSVVLFVGTALFLRTVAGLLAVDTGFRATDVLTAEMNLPSRRYPRYPRPDARVRFARQLTEGLENLPGAEAAALALVVPLSRQDAGHTWASESMAGERLLLPPAKYRPVTPGYFDAVGTRLLAGRTFTWDDVEQYRLVSVVDATLAAKAWPGESAIGKRLRIERWATSGGPIHLEPLWTEVVGVAENVRSADLGEDDIETVYLPYGLYAVSELSLLVRAPGAAAALVDSVRAEAARVDPELAVFNFRVLGELVDAAVAPERYSLSLMGAFGITGFLLALVGVYGVLSHTVSLRRQEFGLRIALGARTSEIGRVVLAHGARLLALGVTLGLAAALGLARFVASHLYGVSPSDPATYAGVGVVIVAVGLVACAAPALRAARTDPMKTLRLEI